MFKNPTYRTSNAYQGGHRIPGMLLNINVFNGNMVPFRFEKKQQNPDLSQFTEAKPPVKYVKKTS